MTRKGAENPPESTLQTVVTCHKRRREALEPPSIVSSEFQRGGSGGGRDEPWERVPGKRLRQPPASCRVPRQQSCTFTLSFIVRQRSDSSPSAHKLISSLKQMPIFSFKRAGASSKAMHLPSLPNLSTLRSKIKEALGLPDPDNDVQVIAAQDNKMVVFDDEERLQNYYSSIGPSSNYKFVIATKQSPDGLSLLRASAFFFLSFMPHSVNPRVTWDQPSVFSDMSSCK